MKNNLDNHDILIVDDIPDNLRILGQMLKSRGFKVRPAPSGKSALLAAEKQKPDLIILDIMMPDMNGYEVCGRLKENPELQEIPVIFISALNETDCVVKGFQLGAVDYITKPFRFEEVCARVDTHLRLYRLQKKTTQDAIKLQELNAIKDRFISVLSHDLRSPLSGIIGLTTYFLDNETEMTNEQKCEFIRLLHNDTTKTYDFLEQLLLWAKQQKTGSTLKKTNFSLNQTILKSISILKSAADKKNINIIFTNQNPVSAFGDENLISTVIRNLLSNAIKFTPEYGVIQISCQSGNNEVCLSVKDSGVGISEQDQARLFRLDTPFSRSGTAKERGSGFGLILCQELIEKHHGHLKIQSEQGKGSTFSFTLPAE
jgi:signal transduction histidine kinase